MPHFSFFPFVAPATIAFRPSRPHHKNCDDHTKQWRGFLIPCYLYFLPSLTPLFPSCIHTGLPHALATILPFLSSPASFNISDQQRLNLHRQATAHLPHDDRQVPPITPPGLFPPPCPPPAWHAGVPASPIQPPQPPFFLRCTHPPLRRHHHHIATPNGTVHRLVYLG